MLPVRWWALLSSACAPVFIIGGAMLAAALQPAGYDQTRDTISALAGLGATDRWVMTVGLAGLGLSHLVTALGLRPAARAGRLLLAAGGLATLLVSALPLPRVGSSTWHGLAALAGFLALAVWPVGASTRAVPGGPVAWGLRGRVRAGAVAVLLALVGWFGVALWSHHLVGLSERFAADAEALWPLLVVISCRAASARTRTAAPVTVPRR